MRLEGSLDAFSLPDIFQLLSFTKKTGGLHLHREARKGVVYFSSGSVTGGSSDTERQSLARRLVGAGHVGDDALAAAVAEAEADPDLGVARALQRAAAVDDGVLHDIAAEHAIDAVFDLMRWQDGEFTFVVDEPNPDDLGLLLAVEETVAEARRRLEAWDDVSRTIPSPEAVLRIPLAAPDDALSVNREEWALLALVDGRRAVSELVSLTGRGEYAVVSALAALVTRGLLVVAAPADEAGEAEGVAALLRRQEALAGLEGGPARPAPAAEPVPAAAPRTAPAPPPPGAAPPAPAAAAVPAQPVVPARAEPFRAPRQPEHPDGSVPVARMGSQLGGQVVGQVIGTAAVAAEPLPSLPDSLIERDPSVNKSLLLRLIAGVRGL